MLGVQERVTSAPGELRHPRLWGAVLVVLSSWLVVLLVDRLRNMAPPGSYGQMNLTYPAAAVVYVVVALLVLVGILLTAAAMLAAGRPANRAALLVVATCGVALLAGAGLAGQTSVSSFGVGCIEHYVDDVHERWADRPTVGEQLTGGLLQGNVADDAMLRRVMELDPDSAGCPGL